MSRNSARPRLRPAPLTYRPPGRTSNILLAARLRAPRRLGPADHALVRQYTPMAYHVAWRFARRRAPDLPADELIGEALFGLTHAAALYDGSREVPFGAFATLAIKRRLVDLVEFWRRDRRASGGRRWLSLPDGNGAPELVDRGPPRDPGAATSALELCERIRGRLPAQWYEALHLYYAEGRTLRDIARRFGVSPEWTRQLLVKAANLAREYFPEGADSS